LDGIRKWLERVYRLFCETPAIKFTNDQGPMENNFIVAYHRFIKNVTNNIANIKFNLGISEMMIFINECYKQKNISLEYLKSFLVVLSCFAPHLAEELYSKITKLNHSIYDET
jgi:leucyl-tRNA synthetase